MVRTMIRIAGKCMLVLLLTIGPVFIELLQAQQDRDRGTVYGVITDVETGDPLAGATIQVRGSNIGSATDVEGRYRLRQLPAGEQTLYVQYIGYEPAEQVVSVVAGEERRVDLSIRMTLLELEGVNVVAQAIGQAGAYNRQRNAPNIMDVASDEQIQRFPDLNVSDALRRMPGISTEEFRGEATAMYVRGMAPGLNTVTLDGERLPTTGNTDRDVSLTGLSSDLVGAIEVVKSITPDMDADAVGGSVNLVANRPVGNQRIFSVSASGGWHNHAGPGNPKTSVHFGESRGDFSYVIRANAGREHRRMDDIRHFWGEQEFNGQTVDLVEQMRIGAYEFQTDRYAVSGRVDYRISDHSSIFVRGLYNLRDKYGERHQFRIRPDRGDITTLNGNLYTIDGVRLEPIGRRNQIRNTLGSFTVGGESDLGNLSMDYSATYAHGRLDSPFQEYLRWRMDGLEMRYDLANRDAVGIEWINGSETAIPDPSNFRMTRFENRIDQMRDNDLNLRMNFDLPFQLDRAAGNIKFGGRFFNKQKEREHTVNEYNNITSPFTFDQVASSGFYRQLVGNRYQIYHFVDWERGLPFRDANRSAFQQNSDDLLEFHLVSDPADYEATETIAAGYLMNTLEWNRWMVLAGVRVENTSTTYLGNRTLIDDSGVVSGLEQIDESSSYINFFPMAHLRYAITDRSNIRAAWTNTIARPTFTDLAPYEIANFESEMLRRGNANLRASRVMNFDLLFEHYFTSVGILSAGLFHKRLQDFVFEEVSIETSGPFQGFEVRMPQNGTTATVWGAEIAWQQRLHFLPGVLSGLGIYSNYSYSTSNAQLRIDREVDLPRQIPHVLNTALTFERNRFYGMLSYNYQSTYLYQVSTTAVSSHRSHLFPTNDRYMRWQERVDLTLRYQASNSIQLFADLRNLTNSPQMWYDGSRDYHYRSSFNHLNGTVGIRFNR